MPDTKPPINVHHATFLAGFNGRQKPITFPDQADSVRRFASGQYRIGDAVQDSMYYIRFYGDRFKLLGRLKSPTPNFDTSENWTAPGTRVLPLPPNQAIFVNSRLYIDAPKIPGHGLWTGLNGRVTVAAAETIFVLRNLMYSCSDSLGKVPGTCGDALGLISERWILVSKQCGAPLHPTRGSQKINAGLAALRGSFGCEGVYDYSCPEFTSLVIHGSIAQKNRGVIHRGLSPSGTGFVQKDYYYDKRFALFPPPHFVPTGQTQDLYVEQ